MGGGEVSVCKCVRVTFLLSAAEFNVTLTYDGSFGIRVGDKPWFTSAPPFLVADGVRYGVEAFVVFPGEIPIIDAPLVWTAAEWVDGKDALGSYRGVSYTYYANTTRLLLTIRAYDSIVVFTQVSHAPAVLILRRSVVNALVRVCVLHMHHTCKYYV